MKTATKIRIYPNKKQEEALAKRSAAPDGFGTTASKKPTRLTKKQARDSDSTH